MLIGLLKQLLKELILNINIYEKIFKARKDGAIVSSNTSSIPIKVLSEHLSVKKKKIFVLLIFLILLDIWVLLEIVKNENNDLNKINH